MKKYVKKLAKKLHGKFSLPTFVMPNCDYYVIIDTYFFKYAYMGVSSVVLFFTDNRGLATKGGYAFFVYLHFL